MDVRLTSDPATAHCRVYVGGVNPEMERDVLQEYFEKYGDVLGECPSPHVSAQWGDLMLVVRMNGSVPYNCAL